MTEKEIRGILHKVLADWDRRAARVVRKVVVPAALGVGLALSGCGDRSVSPTTDAKPPILTEAGQPVYLDFGPAPAYMAPLYAAPQPEYAAPQPEPDASITPPPQPDYAAPMYGGPFPPPVEPDGGQ